MKKIVFILLSSLLSNFTVAQVSFLALDESVELPIEKTSITPDGNIISLHGESLIGFRNSRFTLKKWNGLFWTKLPSFQSMNFPISDDNRMATCVHNNDIYVAASFVNSDSTVAGILKWDGFKWVCPGGGLYSNYVIFPEISVKDLVSFENRLFACGKFNRSGGRSIHNFAYLENDSWHTVETGNGVVNDLYISNDTLYAVGSFNSIEGNPCSNIAAYYNKQWFPINGPNTNELLGISQFDNELVLISKTGIYSGTNNSWNKILNLKSAKWGNSTVFGSALFLAGSFTENDGTLSHLLKWNGNNWEQTITESNVSPKKQNNYFIDNTENGLLFSGKIKSLFGKPVNHIVQLYPGKTVVEGRIYEDVNANCQFDAGDIALPNVIVSINDGQFYSSSNSEGIFNVVVDANSDVNIKIFPNNEFEAICSGDFFDLHSGLKDSSISIQFPLQTRPLPMNSNIHLQSNTGFQARHGYVCNYNLQYTDNEGRYPIQLKLEFDPELKDFYSNLEVIEQRENYVVWNIYEDTEIKLSFRVDHLSFNTGDLLKFKAESQALHSDFQYANCNLVQ
ncbi:MAG: hypothetical protein R2852_02815 [Bacteroidia bacterium]